MTLEEHIADEKQRADSLIISASKLKPEELVVRMVYERGVEEHREKAALLEELMVLRKAFDLSCEEWGALGCCKEDIKHDCDKDCSKHWRDLFVNEVKRRINNDNS